MLSSIIHILSLQPALDSVKLSPIMFYNILNNEKPVFPLLTNILLTSKKGCSHIYKLFRAKPNLTRNTSSSEQKFHTKLNTVLSVDFWNKNWTIFSQLLVSNRIKWMELQLKLYLLPNNYTVNKYNPLINPCCTFCRQSLEEIPHLFWFCNRVKTVWLLLENVLFDIGLPLDINKLLAIFGDNKSNGGSWVNTILSLTRYFIWVEKFRKGTLSGNSFKVFMGLRLKVMKDIFTKKNYINIDPAWGTLFAEFIVENDQG